MPAAKVSPERSGAQWPFASVCSDWSPMRFRFPPTNAVGFPGSTPGSILEVPFMIEFTTENPHGYDIDVRLTEQEETLAVEYQMAGSPWIECGEIEKSELTKLAGAFGDDTRTVVLAEEWNVID